VNRRSFLASAAAGALGSSAGINAATDTAIPIIDTHIHLFDVTRPQGVPWPAKDSLIYKSALPDGYRKQAAKFGIVGAIEIECSPWLEDNQWVLDVAAKDSIIVGMIGDLEPGKPDFAKNLERFRKNPLYLGIRYGNIWNRDLSKEVLKPDFIADIKVLAEHSLVLDSANPDPALMHAAVVLTDKVPNLKMVLDHLPELTIPADGATRKACEDDLKLLAQRPNVYGKISGIVRRENGRVPLDLSFYRDRLDHLWGTFGANKLFYGSDWPNSDQWAQYPDVFRLANEFIASKDAATREKFYWRNSLKAYKWVKRDKSQPVG
jgi:L-fuconolactonase